MSKIKVIVNPLAGRGYAASISPHISAALEALGADFDLAHTRAPGEAIDWGRQAIEDGYDTVVAVGGDGTSHEVINGMMALANGHPVGTLGCIPGGSGNDFAESSGAPTDVYKSCEYIVDGHTRLVDVGRVTIDGQLTRYFANAVGIGFDALVAMETMKHRRLRGMALYVPVVLKTIFSIMRPFQATIETDDGVFQQEVAMAVVCNGPREGGTFVICPEARLDDGLFDVNLTSWMSRPRMLSMVPRFIRGTHVNDPHVKIIRTSRISFVSEDPMYLHVDGEILTGPAHQVEVRILPHALRLIAPPPNAGAAG